MGVHHRLAVWVGDKPWFRPVARRLLPAADKLLLKWFGWRATPWPTLLLTTTGRHSRAPHETPLYFVDHGGDLAVIASNYGGAEPAWSRNLRHDAACAVSLKRRSTTSRAHPASPGEWEDLFERFAAFYPSYRDYRARAGREIPIWILRLESGSATS